MNFPNAQSARFSASLCYGQFATELRVLMSTTQKKTLSTEKSREQVVPRKSLVVRQKVSLRVVAREWVVRLLQMFPRRFVNEQKCPQEKS